MTIGKDQRSPPLRHPAFVVGSGRSGTTFLAKLIDSHPDVLYRHEPDSVLVNPDIPFLPGATDLPELKQPARRYFEKLLDVQASKVSGQRPFFRKSYRTSAQSAAFLAGLYFIKAAERVAGSSAQTGLKVRDFIGESERERILYLIKSVDSPWRTRLFSEAMPWLRILHIMRHPCAVVSSRMRGIESNLMGKTVYLRQAFDAGMADRFPFSLEDLEARSFVERSAFLWMACNQRIYDDMAGNDNYRAVIYDELCKTVEPTIQETFKYLGLSWNEQTQDFIRSLESSQQDGASYFSVMRSPISAVDKWRDQLSSEQIDKIEKIVSHSEVGRRFLNNTWESALRPT